MKPERQDAVLAPAFQKDADDEDFVAALNAALAPHEQGQYDAHATGWPTVHVLGAPRSGTTLVTQLIAGHLGIGNINNLIATFWAAPCHGIRLSNRLGLGGRESNYTSTYGRTDDLHEPHEFGYFWSHHLGYRQMREPDNPNDDPIDWNNLRVVIRNMTAAYGRPIVFKSFMLGFYAAQIQRAMPETRFVFVRRNPLDNAASILRMREQYSGNRDQWTSLKTREYEWLKNESTHVQAVGQVLGSEAAYARALARAHGNNVIECKYEELCAAPGAFLEQVRAQLAEAGVDVPLVREPPQFFERGVGLRDSDPDARALNQALLEVQRRLDATLPE